MSVPIPAHFPDWLTRWVIGHFPVGDPDHIRAVADAWARSAEHLTVTLRELEELLPEVAAAIQGETGEAIHKQLKIEITNTGNQRDFANAVATLLYDSANAIELEQYIVIGIAAVLLANLLIDIAAPAKAIGDRIAADAAATTARRETLTFLFQRIAAFLERFPGAGLAIRAAIMGAVSMGGVVSGAQYAQILQGHGKPGRRTDMDWGQVWVAAAAGFAGGLAGSMATRAVLPALTRIGANATAPAARATGRAVAIMLASATGGAAGGAAGAATMSALTHSKLDLAQMILMGAGSGVVAGFGAAIRATRAIGAARPPEQTVPDINLSSNIHNDGLTVRPAPEATPHVSADTPRPHQETIPETSGFHDGLPNQPTSAAAHQPTPPSTTSGTPTPPAPPSGASSGKPSPPAPTSGTPSSPTTTHTAGEGQAFRPHEKLIAEINEIGDGVLRDLGRGEDGGTPPSSPPPEAPPGTPKSSPGSPGKSSEASHGWRSWDDALRQLTEQGSGSFGPAPHETIATPGTSSATNHPGTAQYHRGRPDPTQMNLGGTITAAEGQPSATTPGSVLTMSPKPHTEHNNTHVGTVKELGEPGNGAAGTAGPPVTHGDSPSGGGPGSQSRPTAHGPGELPPEPDDSSIVHLDFFDYERVTGEPATPTNSSPAATPHEASATPVEPMPSNEPASTPPLSTETNSPTAQVGATPDTGGAPAPAPAASPQANAPLLPATPAQQPHASPQAAQANPPQPHATPQANPPQPLANQQGAQANSPQPPHAATPLSGAAANNLAAHAITPGVLAGAAALSGHEPSNHNATDELSAPVPAMSGGQPTGNDQTSSDPKEFPDQDEIGTVVKPPMPSYVPALPQVDEYPNNAPDEYTKPSGTTYNIPGQPDVPDGPPPNAIPIVPHPTTPAIPDTGSAIPLTDRPQVPIPDTAIPGAPAEENRDGQKPLVHDSEPPLPRHSNNPAPHLPAQPADRPTELTPPAHYATTPDPGTPGAPTDPTAAPQLDRHGTNYIPPLTTEPTRGGVPSTTPAGPLPQPVAPARPVPMMAHATRGEDPDKKPKKRKPRPEEQPPPPPPVPQPAADPPPAPLPAPVRVPRVSAQKRTQPATPLSVARARATIRESLTAEAEIVAAEAMLDALIRTAEGPVNVQVRPHGPERVRVEVVDQSRTLPVRDEPHKTTGEVVATEAGQVTELLDRSGRWGFRLHTNGSRARWFTAGPDDSAAAASEPALRMTFERGQVRRGVSRARREVREFLSQNTRLPEPTIDAAVLALSELLGNAALYAEQGGAQLTIDADDSRIRINITDTSIRLPKWQTESNVEAVDEVAPSPTVNSADVDALLAGFASAAALESGRTDPDELGDRADGEHGRGARIVTDSAQAVGTDVTRHGKTVWVEYRTPRSDNVGDAAAAESCPTPTEAPDQQPPSQPATLAGGSDGSARRGGGPARQRPESLRLDDERRTHILDGDATGGGHRHGTGKPGKTEFPADWDDDKIIEVTWAVAEAWSNPQLRESLDGRTGATHFWQLEDVHEGVHVVVRVGVDGRILTAWPAWGPGVIRNPAPQPPPPQPPTRVSINRRTVRKVLVSRGPNSKAPGFAKFPADWVEDEEAFMAIVATAAEHAIHNDAFAEHPDRPNRQWLLNCEYDGVTFVLDVDAEGRVTYLWPEAGPGVTYNPPTTQHTRQTDTTSAQTSSTAKTHESDSSTTSSDSSAVNHETNRTTPPGRGTGASGTIGGPPSPETRFYNDVDPAADHGFINRRRGDAPWVLNNFGPVNPGPQKPSNPPTSGTTPETAPSEQEDPAYRADPSPAASTQPQSADATQTTPTADEDTVSGTIVWDEPEIPENIRNSDPTSIAGLVVGAQVQQNFLVLKAVEARGPEHPALRKHLRAPYTVGIEIDGRTVDCLVNYRIYDDGRQHVLVVFGNMEADDPLADTLREMIIAALFDRLPAGVIELREHFPTGADVRNLEARAYRVATLRDEAEPQESPEHAPGETTDADEGLSIDRLRTLRAAVEAERDDAASDPDTAELARRLDQTLALINELLAAHEESNAPIPAARRRLLEQFAAAVAVWLDRADEAYDATTQDQEARREATPAAARASQARAQQNRLQDARRTLAEVWARLSATPTDALTRAADTGLLHGLDIERLRLVSELLFAEMVQAGQAADASDAVDEAAATQRYRALQDTFALLEELLAVAEQPNTVIGQWRLALLIEHYNATAELLMAAMDAAHSETSAAAATESERAVAEVIAAYQAADRKVRNLRADLDNPPEEPPIFADEPDDGGDSGGGTTTRRPDTEPDVVVSDGTHTAASQVPAPSGSIAYRDIGRVFGANTASMAGTVTRVSSDGSNSLVLQAIEGRGPSHNELREEVEVPFLIAVEYKSMTVNCNIRYRNHDDGRLHAWACYHNPDLDNPDFVAFQAIVDDALLNRFPGRVIEIEDWHHFGESWLKPDTVRSDQRQLGPRAATSSAGRAAATPTPTPTPTAVTDTRSGVTYPDDTAADRTPPNTLAPDPSRESLERTIRQVWDGQDSIKSESDVYYLHLIAPTEPSSVTDPESHLRQVVGILASRPPGQQTAFVQSRMLGLSEIHPDDVDVISGNPGSVGFIQFRRHDADTQSKFVVYCHPVPDTSPTVMNEIVHEVFDRPDEFPGVVWAKIAGPNTSRNDWITIRVAEFEQAESLAAWLANYQQQHPGLFLRSVPALSYPVADGVSIGFNPPGRDSRGALARRVIFDALQATRAVGGGFAVFREGVLNGLRAAGVDPEHPWLPVDSAYRGLRPTAARPQAERSGVRTSSGTAGPARRRPAGPRNTSLLMKHLNSTSGDQLDGRSPTDASAREPVAPTPWSSPKTPWSEKGEPQPAAAGPTSSPDADSTVPRATDPTAPTDSAETSETDSTTPSSHHESTAPENEPASSPTNLPAQLGTADGNQSHRPLDAAATSEGPYDRRTTSPWSGRSAESPTSSQRRAQAKPAGGSDRSGAVTPANSLVPETEGDKPSPSHPADGPTPNQPPAPQPRHHPRIGWGDGVPDPDAPWDGGEFEFTPARKQAPRLGEVRMDGGGAQRGNPVPDRPDAIAAEPGNTAADTPSPQSQPAGARPVSNTPYGPDEVRSLTAFAAQLPLPFDINTACTKKAEAILSEFLRIGVDRNSLGIARSFAPNLSADGLEWAYRTGAVMKKDAHTTASFSDRIRAGIGVVDLDKRVVEFDGARFAGMNIGPVELIVVSATPTDEQMATDESLSYSEQWLLPAPGEYHNPFYDSFCNHVAATIEMLGADGELTTMVIDPSFEPTRPMTLTEWKDRQNYSEAILFTNSMTDPAWAPFQIRTELMSDHQLGRYEAIREQYADLPENEILWLFFNMQPDDPRRNSSPMAWPEYDRYAGYLDQYSYSLHLRSTILTGNSLGIITAGDSPGYAFKWLAPVWSYQKWLEATAHPESAADTQTAIEPTSEAPARRRRSGRRLAHRWRW
ncbi:WXG100-like domain-containing protein [Nocardia sp. R16R-3T]